MMTGNSETLVWSFTCKHAQEDPWYSKCPPHPPQSSTLPVIGWPSQQGRLHSVTHHQGH